VSARPASPGRAAEARKLGLWSCVALVVGNMIGSGIFLLPVSLAPFGAISLIGWAFTAAGAVCFALVFARLAAMIPKAGGPFAYTRAGFGDFPAFWIAWGYWTALWSGDTAIAVACVSYAGLFFPPLRGSGMAPAAACIGIVWLLAAVNLCGVRSAGRVQNATTIVKLIPLIALATVGLFWVKLEHFTPFNASGQSPFAAVSAVATLTLWSFLGLESATVPAGDVHDPQRTIPRATVIGTLLTTVVYILGTVAVMGIMSREELATSGAPFADAAGSIWGGWASYAVGFGAVVSCFGALNGWILLTGQLPAAAAREGLFPRRFGSANRFGAPAFAIVTSSCLMTALIVFNYSGSKGLIGIFNFVILLATLSTLVPYAFSALVPLLYRGPDDPGSGPPHVSVRSSIVPVLAFLYAVWATYGSGAETVLYGFVLLLLGIPVYVWLKRERAPTMGVTSQ
jgi:basic amino acid/polyamine antiporter, APA family